MALILDGTTRVVQSGIGEDVTTTGPAFSAYLNADVALAANVTVKVGMNAKEFDTATAFNTTTSRFVAPVAGYYMISANVQVNKSTGILTASLWKNGTQYRAGSSSDVTGNRTTVTTLVQLAVNDYVEVFVSSQSAGTIIGLKEQTWITGFLARTA